MATVSRDGERIRARILVDGQRYSASIALKPTARNLAKVKKQLEDARRYLEETGDWATVKSQLTGKSHVIRDSLAHYAQKFLDTTTVARSTLLEYQRTYNRYWGELGNRMIHTLRKSDLRDHLSTFDLDPKTERNAVGVLRLVLKVALEDGLITALPTENWKYERKHKRPPRVYTPEQRDAILESFQHPVAHAFYLTGFLTGMRLEELLALQPEHLDRPDIVVTQVRTRQKVEERTKIYAERRAYAPPAVWTALEPYRFQDWVFQRPNGNGFTDANVLRGELHAAIERAGVPAYPEQRSIWRHTYISIALMERKDPRIVAAQTGHDLQTLHRHYYAFIPRDRDRAELASMFENTI
ncbi:MAG: hypothetical protein AAF918_16110 [Pseudomonadota bacterium]